MEPSLENQALESSHTITTTTTTMNTSTATFPAAPSKNVTFAVNYELPMVDQFMKVERKRRSSTHSTLEVSGTTSSTTTMAHNTNFGALESSKNNLDENENDPEQQQQQHQQPQEQFHPIRSPPSRRISARDKQKRNTPLTRTRVKYDLQLVPVVRRNQAFLDYFHFSWTKTKTEASNASKATRRSNRLLGPSNEQSDAQSSDVCQCQPGFPFLEDSSVLWTPANRPEWEDTVSEMTAVCTQAALRRYTDRTKAFVPPLSRDYIRDRIDIDDPLRGYQLRHKYGGWLQGFVLYTNFTTWTHGFHWDSLHPKSGFPTDGLDHPNMDMDGSLAAELEAEPRAGDPRGGGIVFSSLAEIGLLGGLGCGEYLLRMALTDIWKNTKYKYVVLQATDQSKAFYERFGFVRVGAICQYGKSEKPKVAGRRGRRRGSSMATQSMTSLTEERPAADNGSNEKDRIHELPATTTAITTFPDDSQSGSQSAALDGDAKLPILSENLNEQPVAADGTHLTLEIQVDNVPAASNTVTFTEASEDTKPAVASGRRSVTFEMDHESIGDDSWDPLASEPSEPASTNSHDGESAEEGAAGDSEMHSSAVEMLEYSLETADSATTAEQASGERCGKKSSKEPHFTVDSPSLPAVVMHLPSESAMNDQLVSAEDSKQSSVELSDVLNQPVEEKKDDDVRSSHIENIAASRELNEETNEQDRSLSFEISSLKRQPSDDDMKEPLLEHATIATQHPDDRHAADAKAQSSSTIHVLAVDAEAAKMPASSEPRESHTSERQNSSPSALPIEETQQEYLLRGMSPRNSVFHALSATQSTAPVTPLPHLAAHSHLPPIDFTNMPVVGYRHWTHANESERSLQKHGGPSYMMCLKLPERTSESSDEDFGSCLLCNASRLKSNNVSFTDQMLAKLGVECKPRIENLGATSTPGARRSMSMPLDYNFPSGSLSIDSCEVSPRVDKKLGRRGSDVNSAISFFAMTTSSAGPKNSATTFLSATNTLSQNSAVRVAKMPKRSHSMAEIEGPPRKRPRVEEVELQTKPPAKKPESKADRTESRFKKSSSKARSAKSATEARPPPPQNGQPLSYAQKQYHSVWLAVPPQNPATAASPSSQRAHPLERAALAAIAATKSPTRERRPSAPTTPAQTTTVTTTKRKVGRPPKIGRPAKKSSTTKSFRSATAKSTKTKAKKSSKPPKSTSTTDNGRVFHSVRGPDGKFVRVEVKKVGRPPKAKVGRPPKDKSKTKTTSSTPKRKVSDVRKSNSPKKKKSEKPTPATSTPKVQRSLLAAVNPGKPRTIDPKTFRKQKVVAFPKEKHHFYNKVVRRKRSNAEKFYYVVEYDDDKNLLCIVPMYPKGTLSGQREGRPRYRCDIGETDANFKIVSGADYAVVRSCAIMKTSVVALEAWDIETGDDENFVTRTS